jgi:hypothetical protein
MTREELKKLAEYLTEQCCIQAHLHAYKDGVYEECHEIVNALQKVRDETIDLCADIADGKILINESPTYWDKRIAAQIRTLKEKKE